MILGIDASTPGSGGGQRHLIELLKCFHPEKHGFSRVKIWGVNKTLSQLPDSVNIDKISHPLLNKGFFHRVIWQLFFMDSAFKNQFDVLFCPFGTYTGKIRPYVSMSRNMLIFEESERKRFGMSWMRLKLKLLNHKQKKAFCNSQGIIFLSQYAMKQIGKVVNLKGIETEIINHGVSNNFRSEPKEQHPLTYYNFQNPFKFLYVSTVWIYKHPWNIVEAIANLRSKNYPVTISIVGNDEQKSAGKRLEQAIKNYDPKCEFVTWHKNVSLNEVVTHYQNADAFVFASSCENMPNILIEAMSSGLPIACSSYSPMPEFLEDAGLYFNPTKVGEIEPILEKMLVDHDLRKILSSYSYEYSKKFTWSKCADKTFLFLKRIAKK